MTGIARTESAQLGMIYNSLSLATLPYLSVPRLERKEMDLANGTPLLVESSAVKQGYQGLFFFGVLCCCLEFCN